MANRAPKRQPPPKSVPKAIPTTQPAPPHGAGRRIGFRLLASLGLPLLCLLCAEGLLRLAGYGYSTEFFKRREMQGRAMWIENADFGRRFFPPGLVRSATTIAFPVDKAPNTVRIFIMGESAALGDPDLKFGFSRMLRVLLRERYPDRRIEVVNTAVVAINSHVILPIARDCATRQGDLWVVYMGNNEMVGPFGSTSVFGARAPALAMVRAGLWLKTTRLGQLLDAGLRALQRRNSDNREWAGMEMMAGQSARHDSKETQRVYRHFERNLRDILAVGANAGVPVVLCTVGSNLRDCGPFASLHRQELSAAQQSEWQTAYDSAVSNEEAGNKTSALALYAKAAQIDGEFADLAFRQAQCSLIAGAEKDAAMFFRQARDEDALQFRADSEINRKIRAAAGALASRGVSLVDAEALFADNSPQGSPGADFFYEHVHLTPEGNYLLARAIAEQAAKTLALPSKGQWLSQSDCFELLGLTDWNRFDAFNTILDRIQSAPFTAEIDHTNQIERTRQQLARFKAATKPALVKQRALQVARLVERYPDDPDLRWNLATLLQSAADYARAEEQWRKLMELQPQSVLPVYNLAKLLEGTGRQAEAVQLYAKCLDLNREYYPARLGLGLSLLQMKRVPEAIEHLTVAVREKPGSVEAHASLARALSESGRVEAAKRQWREVLRIDPNNEKVPAGMR